MLCFYIRRVERSIGHMITAVTVTVLVLSSKACKGKPYNPLNASNSPLNASKGSLNASKSPLNASKSPLKFFILHSLYPELA